MPTGRIKVWIGIGSLVGGGAEKQVELLVNQLDPGRFDLRVGYVVDGSDMAAYPRSVCKRMLARTSKWRWDQIWKQVRSEFAEWQPDVVHVWLPEVISLPGAVCARFAGIPVVTSIRRSCYKGIGWRNWGRETLNILPHFFSNRIVANFSLEGELPPLKAFWKWRAARVIPNGVRPSRLNSEALHRNLSINKPLKFVFVGRFAPQKRLPFLIEVLSKVTEIPWKLTVFGRGSSIDEHTIKARVHQLGLEERIHFAGFVSDWREVASDFDYMLFPSVSEGMPNVVVEAMAEGLPVIAGRIPELSPILSDEKNGFYFQPDDANSLLQTIRRVHRQRDHYSNLARGALETARRFSLEALGTTYARLYTELAQKNL